MRSEGRSFMFFCSERDHKPQNSGCGYTTQSFHTAWVIRCRSLHDENRSMSAMPRKRRLAVKASPVAMGQELPLALPKSFGKLWSQGQTLRDCTLTYLVDISTANNSV